MNEEEKLYNELEENYEKIVEMLSNGNFLQLNGKAINLTELNEYINAQQEEIERLNKIIKDIKSQLDYLETYSSKEDVFEDMKRRLDRIDKIIGSDKE